MQKDAGGGEKEGTGGPLPGKGWVGKGGSAPLARLLVWANLKFFLWTVLLMPYCTNILYFKKKMPLSFLP